MDLDKLNRLRVNAGKKPLKAWKASPEKLNEAIDKLEKDGFTDVLPGANVEAEAKTDDPAVAAARPEPEEKPAEETKPKVTNGKPSLARGLDTDGYARHSRKAVKDIRDKERAEKAQLSDADKAQIKEEAKLRKGEVDPKKDPKKAARQKKHIADKQAKRAAAGKTAKPKTKNDNEITVADIARKLDIDPKVARAKLRRYEGKKDFPKPVKGERWTFPKSAEKALTDILK